MTEYEPELGQMLWHPESIREYTVPDFVENGIQRIADEAAVIVLGNPDNDDLVWELPTSNSGAIWDYPDWPFTMRAFDWSDDGMTKSLPNFLDKQTGYEVHWYKHLGRGMSANWEMTRREWRAIEMRLLDWVYSFEDSPLVTNS